MIDLLKQELAAVVDQEDKLNRAREFLQLLALKNIYDKGYFEHLAFVGGTALRVVYGLRRFSEDLDFSLVAKKGYSFASLCEDVKRNFNLSGFNVDIKPKEEKTVQSAFLKFTGLLKEIGLSALKDQKLSIKMDVDTRPPEGGHLSRTLVNKIFIFNVQHFDLPSLFATKLHACFFRTYTKGRDFYDFLWYVGKKMEPNFTLLNNAIKQTQGHDPHVGADNFKEFLLEGIRKTDFAAAKKDVGRFLEDKNELALFRLEHIVSSIESAYGPV